MKNIIIIGSTSYLQSGFDDKLDRFNVQYIHYNAICENNGLLKSADYIINFGIDRIFNIRKLEPHQIIDCKLANIIKNGNTRQIFISSRKVYGYSKEVKIYNEDSPLKPCEIYAHNKITAEKYLMDTLRDRCLIFRVSNVIGEPLYRDKYNTFIGWMCREYINKNKITVDINADSIKDFITKDVFQEYLRLSIEYNLSGIYNLSAGFGITVKEVLESYLGESNIIYEAQHKDADDQFILDNSKLKSIINIKFDKSELINSMCLYRNKLEELKGRMHG